MKNKKIIELFNISKNKNEPHNQRVFDAGGVLSAIMACHGRDPPKILEVEVMDARKVGNLKEDNNSWDDPQVGRVYDASGASPALLTQTGGRHEVKVIERKCTHWSHTGVPDGFQHGLCQGRARTPIAEPCRDPAIERLIVSSRGRDPGNPKSRAGGVPTRQTLEMQPFKKCGTLTTTLKNNLCLERKVLGGGTAGQTRDTEAGYGNAYKTRDGKVYSYIPSAPGVIHVAVVYREGGGTCYKEVVYRVRRLTPKECWRLMGFSDTDFEAAKKVNSNTALYNQAGNSIVKNVLMAIFRQML